VSGKEASTYPLDRRSTLWPMGVMRVEHVPMCHFILFLSCLRGKPELAVLFSDPPIPPKMDPSLRVFLWFWNEVWKIIYK